MHYPDRVTVCVSTQAGCAMACQFCATGQAGSSASSRRGDRRAGGRGDQGGPAPAALQRGLHGDGGAAGQLRPSLERGRQAARRDGLVRAAPDPVDVGVVPGIRRLAAEALPVNLAVSLHAANDAKRDVLVPLNRRYPLAMVAEACGEYVAATGRRLSIEWAMIHDVNDQGADASELAQFARPLAAHVNLIPLNPTPGYAVRGSSARRCASSATNWKASASTPPCA